MPERVSFDYAVIRVVPRVDREEFVNVGVILHCLQLNYLDVRVALDHDRIRALCPGVDLDLAGTHVEAFARVCGGDPDAGPIARLPRRERFHWLVSPRSTIVQVSPVHTGLCDDPAQALDALFDRLVALADCKQSRASDHGS